MMTTSVERAAVRFEAVVPHMAVADVVRTAEYYRDILGFEIAGYWDGEEVHRAPTRSPVFGIVQRGQASMVNLDALDDELRGRGAEILDGPEERVYGQRELVVRDCNGFILAFGEPLQTGAT